jgi:mannose-6-phosphate isomerase-like protein (cupin superfamily)
MKKLTIFTATDEICPVSFIETQEITEGVECDVYAFTEDSSKDLTIVKVIQGYRTPLQKVVAGSETLEGYMEGEGTLRVMSVDGELMEYHFNTVARNQSVAVKIGEKMQWYADGNTDLIFYEICSPVYEKGQFEDMPGVL